MYTPSAGSGVQVQAQVVAPLAACQPLSYPPPLTRVSTSRGHEVGSSAVPPMTYAVPLTASPSAGLVTVDEGSSRSTSTGTVWLRVRVSPATASEYTSVAVRVVTCDCVSAGLVPVSRVAVMASTA